MVFFFSSFVWYTIRHTTHLRRRRIAYESFAIYLPSENLKRDDVVCLIGNGAGQNVNSLAFGVFPHLTWSHDIVPCFNLLTLLRHRDTNSGVQFLLFGCFVHHLYCSPMILGCSMPDEHLDNILLLFSENFFVNGLHLIAEKWHFWPRRAEKSIRCCSMLLHWFRHCPKCGNRKKIRFHLSPIFVGCCVCLRVFSDLFSGIHFWWKIIMKWIRSKEKKKNDFSKDPYLRITFHSA